MGPADADDLNPAENVKFLDLIRPICALVEALSLYFKIRNKQNIKNQPTKQTKHLTNSPTDKKTYPWGDKHKEKSNHATQTCVERKGKGTDFRNMKTEKTIQFQPIVDQEQIWRRWQGWLLRMLC